MDLLKPPPGYRLDRTVLTTYSLDLEVLLALPLAVLAQTDAGVEQLLQDPLVLLEAIREAGERIQVFVDEAGIAVPANGRTLYGALESSVHPVKAPNGGAFHPKVWVARFLSEDQSPLIRVSVASRNLTFDRSWDIALTSEALPGKRTVSAIKPLADMLRRLPGLGNEALDDAVTAGIEQLAHEIQRTVFPAPEGFDSDLEFHVLGLGKQRGHWCPVEQVTRVLAIAPFVSDKALHKVASLASGESLLVSRADQLSQLDVDLLGAWSRVEVLSSTADGEAEDGSQARPSGLHAKLMVFEQGHRATWFIGSANLTDAAFTGNNVEVMVSASGPKGRPGGKGVGINLFLESGFRRLCEDYDFAEFTPDEESARDAANKLKLSREALLGAELYVSCRPAEGDWQMAVHGGIVLPQGVTLTTWPLSVEGHQAKTWQDGVSWNLPIARLTAFVAFSIAVDGHDEELRLAIKLPVEGMPEERIHHVLRTLIDSPERFLQFLRALLGGLEEIAGLIGERSGQPWNFAGGQGLRGEPLLEDMLRAASRDPQRLIPVRRLIADLRQSEEGRKIVPDELYAVWQAVDSVLADKEAQ
ncbi:phospholipase D family protein [Metapseudomonas sp. CR1201]